MFAADGSTRRWRFRDAVALSPPWRSMLVASASLCARWLSTIAREIEGDRRSVTVMPEAHDEDLLLAAARHCTIDDMFRSNEHQCASSFVGARMLAGSSWPIFK